MDFLDPKKKRTHTIRLFIGYFAIGVGLAIGAIILLLQVNGFDLDRKTGNIIQNGLIFLDSHPVKSDVYVNGQQNKSRTDTRLALPSGTYDIELRENGYRSWKHVVNLEGGSVERLVYPVLFPTDLITNDVKTYDARPGLVTSSPDRQWLLIQQPGSHTTFDSYNLINFQQTPQTVAIPSNILKSVKGAQSFELVEWSTDNRHVLLKHSYNGGYEFIMLDRQQPSSSFNLSTLVGNSPSEVSLRDKKYDQYYVYSSKNKLLYTYDIKSKNLEPVLTNVLAYKSHGDNVLLYATPSDEQSKAATVKLKEGDQTYTINTFPDETKFLLDIARFDNKWYAVVTTKSQGMTYIYKNPQDGIKASQNGTTEPLVTITTKNPDFLSFSENTRFICVQSGSEFNVYDNETDRRYYFKLKQKVSADHQAYWMDGHRLTLVLNKKTEVFDFDGTNQQTLSPGIAGSNVFFDRDYKGLYNIAPASSNAKKYALARTDLIVK